MYSAEKTGLFSSVMQLSYFASEGRNHALKIKKKPYLWYALDEITGCN